MLIGTCPFSFFLMRKRESEGRERERERRSVSFGVCGSVVWQGEVYGMVHTKSIVKKRLERERLSGVGPHAHCVSRTPTIWKMPPFPRLCPLPLSLFSSPLDLFIMISFFFFSIYRYLTITVFFFGEVNIIYCSCFSCTLALPFCVGV